MGEEDTDRAGVFGTTEGVRGELNKSRGQGTMVQWVSGDSEEQ